MQGRTPLISAHGNSLRGLVKYLDDVPDEEIPGFEMPDRQAPRLRTGRQFATDRYDLEEQE